MSWQSPATPPLFSNVEATHIEAELNSYLVASLLELYNQEEIIAMTIVKE